MQRNCITEFSKIYRRLLNIEISLKDNFFNVMKKVHNDKLFFRIIPYVKILIKFVVLFIIPKSFKFVKVVYKM